MVPGAGLALSLQPVDRILLAWAAVAGAVAVARWEVAPAAGWALMAHGLLALLACTVRRGARSRAGEVLGALYPLLLLPALYGSLDLLAGSGGVRTWDRAVQDWEAGLFGTQPSRSWWQAMPSPALSTLFHAAYLSYYLVLPAGPLWFLLRGDRRSLDRSVLAIVATFVLCYLCFLFVPVAGPYYEFPRPDPALLDNWAARAVYGLLSGASSYGAAFPSSHVAAALVASAAAAMGSRRLGLALFLPSALLTVGVVYTQMHYAVDALAGVAVAAVVTLALRARQRRQGG